MKQFELDNNQFLYKIKSLFGNEHYFRVSLIGWQDGNYFKELCDEDGGVIDKHYYIFRNLPLSKKVDKDELQDIIHQFQTTPFLTSLNGNYKYQYDLHIWSKKYYIVYSAYLQKLIIKEVNILDKVFSPTIQPYWQGK